MPTKNQETLACGYNKYLPKLQWKIISRHAQSGDLQSVWLKSAWRYRLGWGFVGVVGSKASKESLCLNFLNVRNGGREEKGFFSWRWREKKRKISEKFQMNGWPVRKVATPFYMREGSREEGRWIALMWDPRPPTRKMKRRLNIG